MRKNKIVSILLSVATTMSTFGSVFAQETTDATVVSEVTEQETQPVQSLEITENPSESEQETSAPVSTVESVSESVQSSEESAEQTVTEPAVSQEETSEQEESSTMFDTEIESAEKSTEELEEESAEESTEKLTEEETSEEVSSEEETSAEEEPSHAVTSGMMTGGYIPSDLDTNVPVHGSWISLYSNVPAAYPGSSYADSAAVVQTNYPEVRNQNPYGTCWAFSSLGLAEFDLINDGAASPSIDLSELQLAYFLFNSAVDPLGGTKGDQSKYYNENASVNYLNYGGNYEMAARRLAQWSGAVNESLVPYSGASTVLSSGLPDEYAYQYDVAHLQNAYCINIKQNADDVKQNIMEHGAVGVMYYHDDFSMLWNSDKQLWTYYDAEYKGSGHAVMIVGWDDNFSKDLFVGTKKPSKDGAWLVRNSWGFQQSYFWMSYENASLLDSAWAFDFTADNSYDHNYQYDGGLRTYYNTQYTTTSNIYTVPQKNTSELLEAVSVSFTRVADVSYTVSVYTDLTNSTNPLSGTRQEAATTQGMTAYAGIYTIPLENPVELKPGSTFAVVVSTDKPCVDYDQGINYENNGKPVWTCAVTTVYKSYYLTGGRYYYYPWGDFCIKALTSDYTAPQSYSITYNVNDGINHSANPTSYMAGSGAIVLQDPSREGYRFMGWYTDVDCTAPITEIPAGAAQNYVLYAKWQAVATVIFNGFASMTLSSTEYNLPVGSNSDIQIPNPMPMDGYEWMGWKVNSVLYSSNEIASVIRRNLQSVHVVTVESVYEQKELIYSLKVKNGKLADGTLEGLYKPGDVVSVTANEAVSGEKFAYWLKDGLIASYSTSWKFYMPERNVSIEAVYKKNTESIEQMGTSCIESICANSENKTITFVSVGNVPVGCSIEYLGVVATSDADTAKNLTTATAEFVRGDGAGYQSYKYTWTKGNVKGNEIWYVRSYLKYKDASGNIHEMYGDVVSSSIGLSVVFRGFNSSLLSNEAYDLPVGTADAIKVPAAAIINGYVWKGWNLDGKIYSEEAIVPVIKDKLEKGNSVSVSSEYEKVDLSYKLIVNNGVLENGAQSGSYKTSDIITVTANDAQKGEKFAYWLKNGQIANFDSTWNFYMPEKDTTVTAVYVNESDTIKETGISSIETIKSDKTANQLTFVSIGSVPQGCKIEISGVVASSKNANDVTVNNAEFLRGEGKGYRSFKYTWTKRNVTEAQIWYVRSYLKYTDQTGNSHEVYGDLQKVSLNSVQ